MNTDLPTLPQWPQRTVAVLSSVDEGVHAIPVSAPVRAGDRQIVPGSAIHTAYDLDVGGVSRAAAAADHDHE